MIRQLVVARVRDYDYGPHAIGYIVRVWAFLRSGDQGDRKTSSGDPSP